MRTTRRLALVSLIGLLSSSSWYRPAETLLAADDNAVTARDLVVDPPTLINLGFEWFIDGDDNRNAAVDVSYRKAGERDWKRALPLLRLQGERIYNGAQLDVISPNMFAGSILDLEPDTAYEAQFMLSDPDGVSGESEKRLTRADAPGADAGGRRADVSRLSAGLHRAEDRAVVRRADVRLQPDLRRARTGRRRGGRASGRATPSWCTPASTSTTATSTPTTPPSTARCRSTAPTI